MMPYVGYERNPNEIENLENWVSQNYMNYSGAHIYSKICGGLCAGLAVAGITAFVISFFKESHNLATAVEKSFELYFYGSVSLLGVLSATRIIPGLAEILVPILLIVGVEFAKMKPLA